MSSGISFIGRAEEWLLSWFQYIVDSVISTLSGGTGSGFLNWLSTSWPALLAFFLIAGTALNIIIYVIRWRPHWWMFAKKRMIIDESLLEPEKRRRSRSHNAGTLSRRPSTLVPRRESSTKSRLTRDEALFDPDEDEDLMEIQASKNKKRG